MKNAPYMQLYLAAYVEASKKNARDAKFVSVATDKGRIHGRNVMLTALVLPDNMASWLPPQAPLDMACFRRFQAEFRCGGGGSKPIPRVCFHPTCVWSPPIFFRHVVGPRTPWGSLNQGCPRLVPVSRFGPRRRAGVGGFGPPSQPSNMDSISELWPVIDIPCETPGCL